MADASNLPAFLLVGYNEDGDCFEVGTVEYLAANGFTIVGRYKRVGTGKVHAYADYVEDETT